MVYNWGQYEDICLELYINQNSTLEEIREYFKQTFGFSPSARAFQHHFHEWGFPAKREAAHRNSELVKRVEQLWETNITHKEMLHILAHEGFSINYKELKNLRRKNGWRLWTPRQDTPSSGLADPGTEPIENSVGQNFEPAHLLPTAPNGRGHHGDGVSAFGNDCGMTGALMGISSQSASPDAAPGPTASRRRNRYKRDASGAVSRFPSEMTLDEARTALGLDLKAYARVRLRFQQVCEKEKVIKKTLAGPQKWDDLMARLVRATPELASSIPPPQPRARPQTHQHGKTQHSKTAPRDADRRLQALDVICTDVTKRIRTAERRISMAGARTALGLNPREARGVRAAFEEVLAAAGISAETCAVGSLDWDGLYRAWADRSDKVRALLGCAAEDREETLGLLLFVARDVIKRIKDHARRSGRNIRQGSGSGSSAEQTATPEESAPPYQEPMGQAATISQDPADQGEAFGQTNRAHIPPEHAALEQTAVTQSCPNHAAFAQTASLPADPSHHMAMEQAAFPGNPSSHHAAIHQMAIPAGLSHDMAGEQQAMGPHHPPYHAAAFEQAAIPAGPDHEAACIDGMDLGSWAHDLAPHMAPGLAGLGGFDQHGQMLGAGVPKMGVGAWSLTEQTGPVLGEPYPILVHNDQIIFWYQNRWHVVQQ